MREELKPVAWRVRHADDWIYYDDEHRAKNLAGRTAAPIQALYAAANPPQEERSDPLGLAAGGDNREALVEALAELDAAEKSCPAANGKLGGRECPKCGAGLGQNCGPSLRKMDGVIRAAKALAPFTTKETDHG